MKPDYTTAILVTLYFVVMTAGAVLMMLGR